jgi:hypothetical protein
MLTMASSIQRYHVAQVWDDYWRDWVNDRVFKADVATWSKVTDYAWKLRVTHFKVRVIWDTTPKETPSGIGITANAGHITDYW